MSQRRVHGAAVRAIREALGISLTKCATDVGISVGYLSRVERGSKNPTSSVIVSLAERLGVPVDAITVTTATVTISPLSTITIEKVDAA